MAFLKPLGDTVEEQYRDVSMIREVGGPSLAARVEGPVMCGWCRSLHQTRPQSPNCEHCGGVLPMPPGADPGPPPTAPPRKLPAGFRYNLYVKQNIGGVAGVILILVSIPFLIFGIPTFLLGLYIAWYNLGSAYMRQVALQRGVPVPGRIESVDRMGGEDSGHGSVLYRVYFRFDAEGEGYLGLKWTYDPAIENHFAGEPIWVVHVPQRPKYYAIWPPLA